MLKSLKDNYTNPISRKLIAENSSLSSSMFDDQQILLDYVDFDAAIKETETLKTVSLSTNGSFSKTDYAGAFRLNIVAVMKNHLIFDNGQMYAITSEGWSNIGRFAINKLDDFLYVLSDKQIPMNMLPSIRTDIKNQLSIDQYDNSVIQFKDGYLKQGQYFKGFYTESMPKFVINRKVDKLISTNKLQVRPSKEMNEFLNIMLTDNGRHPESYDYLLDLLSSIFINDTNFIQSHGKMLRFYGPTAENGKSTLLNLLKSTIGESNYTSVSMSSFKGYSLSHAVNSLLAVDPDSSSMFLDEEVSSNIKSVVTADSISVRDIYQTPQNIQPITTIITASNNLPMAADKSNGLLRRMIFIKLNDKLQKEPVWFDHLKSEQSIEYLFEKLLLNAIRMLKSKSMHDQWQDKDVELLFQSSNNNVLEFIEIYGAATIRYNAVGQVFELYKQYCDENARTAFGPTRFAETIQEKLHMKKQNKSVAFIDQHLVDRSSISEEFSMILSNKSKSRKIYSTWVPM